MAIVSVPSHVIAASLIWVAPVLIPIDGVAQRILDFSVNPPPGRVIQILIHVPRIVILVVIAVLGPARWGLGRLSTTRPRWLRRANIHPPPIIRVHAWLGLVSPIVGARVQALLILAGVSGAWTRPSIAWLVTVGRVLLNWLVPVKIVSLARLVVPLRYKRRSAVVAKLVLPVVCDGCSARLSLQALKHFGELSDTWIILAI